MNELNFIKIARDSLRLWLRDASVIGICTTVIMGTVFVWVTLMLFSYFILNFKDDFPQFAITALACCIALSSLALAAVSLLMSSRRLRRQETIRAYQEWSRETLGDVRTITNHLGKDEDLSYGTVSIILDTNKRSDENLKSLKCGSTCEIDKIARSIRNTLNGLEILSVGVNEGIYDRDTLRHLAGSKLIGLHKYFGKYIHAVQKGIHSGVDNSRAYESFQWMAEDLEYQNALEKRQERTRYASIIKRGR
ncbi:DUF4760 domain-containing protein [Kocuria sp. cx-455]|uniref:DUF4760 domain-containing protein n=1 Tax=Kocuria sp. cx-455 TaxID=2771377 RepID=UPI0016857856|nr:DUF4760 domain-containing protein [Kocuria sp. cx-455]MBD2765516.1 DUF4760 domain-containing protein [Kocuria sp. cx-455]